MGKDITAALRPALSFIILLTLITGLLYPLLITGIGQTLFPHQANGSLIREGNRVVGSELIGQNFAGARYFHPRPSGAGDGYDAAASSGSNLGPTSADLKTAIEERVGAARAEGIGGVVPADMVTASGSGLDPDISPANAYAQVERIALARRMPVERVRKLVHRSIDRPALGLLGSPRVNVLLLNRQLDRFGAQAPR